MATPPSADRLFIPALGPLNESIAGLAWPIVRVVTGLWAMPHGAQKLFAMFGGNPEGLAKYFSQIGLEPAAALVVLVGLVEFAGGFLLVIGWLTRPAAAAMAITMAVAAFLVHLGPGFFWSDGGYEYPLMWAMMALAVFCHGGGRFSLDRAIGKEF